MGAGVTRDVSGREIVPAAEPNRGSLPAQAADALRHLMQPVATYRKLAPWLNWATGNGAGVWRAELDPKRAAEHAPKARDWLAAMPPASDITAASFAFYDAATESATPAQIKMVLGVLVDAFPQASKPNVGMFIEAALLVLEGDPETPLPSACVLATSTPRLLRQHRLLPAISEIVAEAQDVRRKFWGAHLHAEHLLALRYSAEDVLLDLGEWRPPPDGFDDDAPGGGA